jgi:hypothetical protein
MPDFSIKIVPVSPGGAGSSLTFQASSRAIRCSSPRAR